LNLQDLGNVAAIVSAIIAVVGIPAILAAYKGKIRWFNIKWENYQLKRGGIRCLNCDRVFIPKYALKTHTFQMESEQVPFLTQQVATCPHCKAEIAKNEDSSKSQGIL